MTAGNWYTSDEELLTELRRALRDDEPVPPRVLEAAKAVYAWRTVDAELAALAYDSAVHEDLAAVRSESASVRTMTFESGRLVVEIGVADGNLVGQVVPAAAYGLVVRRPGREPTPVSVDELGCFRIEPLPDGPFSLLIRTPDDVVVATDWVSL